MGGSLFPLIEKGWGGIHRTVKNQLSNRKQRRPRRLKIKVQKCQNDVHPTITSPLLQWQLFSRNNISSNILYQQWLPKFYKINTFKHCKAEKEQYAKWELFSVPGERNALLHNNGSSQMWNSGNRSHEKSKLLINSVYFSKVCKREHAWCFQKIV